jgi:predicted regulator of Ras-like GTPase activity (Roadblock/LC7/MglB family)
MFKTSMSPSRDLIGKSEATSALILDKGGFVIAECGDTRSFDTTTLGALAAAAYAATQGIASLVGEANFSSVYQQGENYSLLVNNVDEHCLLVVIFNAQISVGAVKYYAMGAITQVARQLQVARTRSPDEGSTSPSSTSPTPPTCSPNAAKNLPPATQNLDLQPLFARKGAQSVAEAPAEDEEPAEDPVAKLQKIKNSSSPV